MPTTHRMISSDPNNSGVGLYCGAVHSWGALSAIVELDLEGLQKPQSQVS
jgi:hypothetical protein